MALMPSVCPVNGEAALVSLLHATVTYSSQVVKLGPQVLKEVQIVTVVI